MSWYNLFSSTGIPMKSRSSCASFKRKQLTVWKHENILWLTLFKIYFITLSIRIRIHDERFNICFATENLQESIQEGQFGF